MKTKYKGIRDTLKHNCFKNLRIRLLSSIFLFIFVPSAFCINPRPNIVFILADDLGYGDLSSYGATKVQTPNIDRLAIEGRRFTDAHSPHPVCTPSRYSLMTGRYSWRTWAKTANVWSDDPLLIEEGRYTLSMLLKDAGYKTGIVGKWHLGFGRPGEPGWDENNGINYNGKIAPGPLEVGFDYFFGIPHVGQNPHVFIENHHIVGLSPEDPIKLVRDDRWINRPSFLERYGFPPTHTFEGGKTALYRQEDVASTLTEKAQTWLKENATRPFFLYLAHRNVHSPLRPNENFQGKSEIGVYGDFILELDWSVGQILDTLDELGVSENTLVLFSSDNGGVQMGHQPTEFVDYNGHAANGRLRGQKTESLEGGHRVPLLARWPSHIKAGSQSDNLVANTDTLATVAELLGLKLPEDAGPDSISYLGALLDQKPTQPVRSVLVHESYRGGFGIRQNEWKLLMIQGGGGIGWSPFDYDRNKPMGQLYNLKEDLKEEKNLYNEYPEIVERMSELLREIRKSPDSVHLSSDG
jgi:arylsulfatase A